MLRRRVPDCWRHRRARGLLRLRLQWFLLQQVVADRQSSVRVRRRGTPVPRRPFFGRSGSLRLRRFVGDLIRQGGGLQILMKVGMDLGELQNLIPPEGVDLDIGQRADRGRPGSVLKDGQLPENDPSRRIVSRCAGSPRTTSTCPFVRKYISSPTSPSYTTISPGTN